MGQETVVALSLLAGLFGPASAQADVNVGINVGTPAPPPIVVAAPPQLVVVPGTPVHYAPNASFNLFVYGGRHYTFHEGVWFSASTYRGPWVVVPVERVPKPVLAVPVTYYRVPPGQAKKMNGGGPPGHAKAHVKGPKASKGNGD